MGLSSRRLFTAVLFLALFAMTAKNVTDPDFGWHLRTGEIIVTSGSVPEMDSFSFTAAGEPRVEHEWLVDAAIYVLFNSGGYAALILFFALAATTAFILLYFRCPGRPYFAGFGVLLAALASAPFWGVRPLTISLLFTSATLTLLDRYRREGTGRYLLWLIPLTVLWANSHGSFFIAPALIIVYLISSIVEGAAMHGGLGGVPWKNAGHMFGVLIGTVLVIAINPVGLALYRYPLETLNSRVMQTLIQEWQSPNLHALEIQPFILMLFLTLLALGYRGRRSGVVEALLVVGLAVASLRQARQISLWVLVAAPVIAAAAQDLLDSFRTSLPQVSSVGPSRSQSIVNAALLFLVAGAALVRVGLVISDQPRAERIFYPVAAVDFIKAQNLSGPLINLYDWGGYLIWKLYPRERVFIDGRADLYAMTGDRVVRQYLQAYYGGSDWRAPLEQYNIRLALVAPDAPLAGMLDKEPGWRKLYEDDKAAVYSR